MAVEVREDKPRFATMQQVESMSEDDISKAIDERLGEDVTARSGGRKAYGFFILGKAQTSTYSCGFWKKRSKGFTIIV